MNNKKICIKNAYLLTGECESGSREKYTVVTEGRVIAHIFRQPLGEADSAVLRDCDRVIDADGMLLMPGLYNCHTHSPMTLFRGMGDNLSLDSWLNDCIFPAEDLLNDERVRVGSMMSIAEMIRGGTVSFSDMYFFCPQTAEAVGESGMKANISRSVVSFDPSADWSRDSRFAEAEALFRDYNGAFDGRVLIDVALHAEYTNVASAVRYASDMRDRLGCRTQVHLSETEREHLASIERHGRTPAGFFDDNGFLDSALSCAHCVWLSDEDIALLAERGATVVHNPGSNLKLGSGIMPLRRMLDAGINVTVGTDGAASNNKLDLLSELRLSLLLQRGASCAADSISSDEMIPIGTKNGAISQGRSGCGLIREGYAADMILVDLRGVSNLPVRSLSSSLIFSASSSDVFMTMCDGRILYENGEYKTLDEEKIKSDFMRVMGEYFPNEFAL